MDMYYVDLKYKFKVSKIIGYKNNRECLNLLCKIKEELEQIYSILNMSVYSLFNDEINARNGVNMI